MNNENPNTEKNIDWAVEAFAGKMKEVLLDPKNMKKTTWEQAQKQTIESHLLKHAQNLAGIIDPHKYEIACANIANLAMMSWQNSIYQRSEKG